MQGMPSDQLRFAGRWSLLQTLEHYVQESVSEASEYPSCAFAFGPFGSGLAPTAVVAVFLQEEAVPAPQCSPLALTAFTTGQMLRQPGVTPLVLALQRKLASNFTYGQFASDTQNLSAMQAAAKRRKEVLPKCCKAVLACKELEEALGQIAPFMFPGPPIGAPVAPQTAIVPLPPPQAQPAQTNGVTGGQGTAAPRLQPQQMPAASPPQPWAEWAGANCQSFLGWLFATAKARVLTMLCIVIFPQLVSKLFARCLKLAVVTLSTEVVGTVVAASDAIDSVIAPMLSTVVESL